MDQCVLLRRYAVQYVGQIPTLAPGRWNVILASPAWRLLASLDSVDELPIAFEVKAKP